MSDLLQVVTAAHSEDRLLVRPLAAFYRRRCSSPLPRFTGSLHSPCWDPFTSVTALVNLSIETAAFNAHVSAGRKSDAGSPSSDNKGPIQKANISHDGRRSRE